jgi:hypothetical protein
LLADHHDALVSRVGKKAELLDHVTTAALRCEVHDHLGLGPAGEYPVRMSWRHRTSSPRIGDAPQEVAHRCVGLLETLRCGQSEFWGCAGRDPDCLIKCFIKVLLIAVGVNLLSSFVATQKWAWLPPAVFVAALLVAVLSAGLLRPERYGTTRARAMALFALTSYLAVTVWAAVTGWPLP